MVWIPVGALILFVLAWGYIVYEATHTDRK